jgi:hypothetical protein
MSNMMNMNIGDKITIWDWVKKKPMPLQGTIEEICSEDRLKAKLASGEIVEVLIEQTFYLNRRGEIT